MNSLHILKFIGADLRLIVIDNKAWFVWADVCRILGFRGGGGSTYLLKDLGHDEKRKVTFRELVEANDKGLVINTPRSLNVQLYVVSEPGLYKLALRSKKREAKAFQDWVARDVLPAIRQSGTYTKPADVEVPILDDLRSIATLLRQEATLMEDLADAKDIVRQSSVNLAEVRKQRVAMETARKARKAAA